MQVQNEIEVVLAALNQAQAQFSLVVVVSDAQHRASGCVSAWDHNGIVGVSQSSPYMEDIVKLRCLRHICGILRQQEIPLPQEQRYLICNLICHCSKTLIMILPPRMEPKPAIPGWEIHQPCCGVLCHNGRAHQILSDKELGVHGVVAVGVHVVWELEEEGFEHNT